MTLMSDHGIVILVAILAVAAVAMTGGFLTEIGDWYEGLRFPAWRPPNWLFAPAWTLIYVLVAASGAMAWEHAQDAATRTRLIELFALNAVLNIAWSALFFRFRRPDWALFELAAFWLSILALLIFIAGIEPLAALILSPYLVWVTFAGWLNWRVVQLNRPFGGY